MPKIVDHDKRRLELVEATWRIIARRGIEGATMREIATEAGFANGALKPYFPTKDDLLSFAFAHVFNQTNARIAGSSGKKKGLAALRSFCHEILPLDAERLSEARIAIAYWQRALTDPDKAALHDASMEQWRRELFGRLREARDAGELRDGLDDDDVVGGLMTFVLGAQITATLSPSHHSPRQLRAQLESFLRGVAKA
ncbi:TetR family transcriptional regulator [Arthrobacter sp. SW1]|uniref:TetR/AcrR family transcriptional regulator n=1 Tax=Arthrobacter sp. SW1 TaxID=1920889 RepID=UPI000877E8D7|nr:TetR family transcriptional regulator C-terminal domain-containing protein [Arthrobacter sp. SW1]OFI38125.1 TetR family transcriptional regulator [Arthrobacter sp. SW1]